MAVGPGARDLRLRATGVGEAGVTLFWHLHCILQARGQVACEEQDDYGRRDRQPGLPGRPSGRAEEVSKLILGLLKSLLGNLPGSVYFQNPFAVRFAVGLCN